MLYLVLKMNFHIDSFFWAETQELDEYFIDMPAELCELKIIGFSKDIGSSVSLLPSIMHRLENLLVAIELKSLLSASFSEGAEVSAFRVRPYCRSNYFNYFFFLFFFLYN